MEETKPKFALGVTLWTIDGCKARSFTANFIGQNANGYLYGESQFSLRREAECFTDKDELLAYVAAE